LEARSKDPGDPSVEEGGCEVYRQGSWRRYRRRDVLGRAAGIVAVAASAGVVSACAGQAGSAQSGSSATPATAAPTPGSGVTVIHFQSNWQGAPWNKTSVQLVQNFIDANFNQNPKYKGLWAVVDPSGWGNAQGQITAAIAGSSYNDVVHSCCQDLVVYQSGGWLVPLDDYLKRDNITTNLWSKGHVDVLTFDGKVMALPSYDGPGVISYRQDILDELGLPYPDPNWTWKEATQIWTQCAGLDKKTNRWRYGVSPYTNGPYEWLNSWMHAFGGLEMSPDRTVCLVNQPPGIQALQYLQQLYTQKIAIARVETGGFVNGQAVFCYQGGWQVLPLAQQAGNKFKWDFIPTPFWPGGRATFDNIDFYGIHSASKHPDEAWELLRWLAAEPDYQRFQIQATLVEPCLLSLWDYWETTVKQVAPPLANKQLHWYADAAKNGYGWPTMFFKYAPAQTDNVINQWFSQILAGQVDPALGANQMAAQINAIQKFAAAEAQTLNQVKANFPTHGPEIAAVPTGI
jgi:multiple sugar transport system substrate-binding protein